MTTEYKQKIVKEVLRDDPTLLPQVRIDVAMGLSRMCSETDDPDEFYVDALFNITYEIDEDESLWIKSYLDRDPIAEYLEPNFVAPYKVPVPFGKKSEPTDMTPEELARHMAEKAKR